MADISISYIPNTYGFRIYLAAALIYFIHDLILIVIFNSI